MGVQLAAAAERKEGANRTRRVPSAREQKQVRPGAGGQDRPVLRMAANDVERVRDRDALEPEIAQETVRARLERRPTQAECRIDAVTDHHARHARLDRSTVRRKIGLADSTDDVRMLVRGKPQRAEAREVLDARAGAARREPAGKRNAEGRGTKLPRSEWAVREVEHRCEVDVDARAAQRTPRRRTGFEGLCLAPDRTSR